MGEKLSKAMRKTLRWLSKNEPASLIPVNGPSLMMLRLGKAAGYVDDSGRSRDPRSSFPLAVYVLTTSGRAALSNTGANNGK